MGENGYMCVCMAECLHSSPDTTTTLLIGCTPIQNKKLNVCEKKRSFFFLSLKEKKKSKEKAVGLPKFYRTGQHSYLATNMLYPLRKRKYNPKVIQGSSGLPAPFQRVGPLLPFLQTQSLGKQSAGRAVGVMLRPKGPGRRNIKPKKMLLRL